MYLHILKGENILKETHQREVNFDLILFADVTGMYVVSVLRMISAQNAVRHQGDQIWRIFADWAVVYFLKFFNCHSDPQI
jgi:hypothetical protein